MQHAWEWNFYIMIMYVHTHLKFTENILGTQAHHQYLNSEPLQKKNQKYCRQRQTLLSTSDNSEHIVNS